MAIGYFQVGDAREDPLVPQQYGYLLLGWSFDNATGFLNDLTNSTLKDSAYATTFRSNFFWAHLQIVALYSACYWYYASHMLYVPEEAQHEMRSGLDRAIKDIIDPAGNPLSELEVKLFRASIRDYVLSISNEFTHATKADPKALRLDTGAISNKFFELIVQAYPDLKAFSPVDQLLFGHYIADIPPMLLSAVKNELRITYVLTTPEPIKPPQANGFFARAWFIIQFVTSLVMLFVVFPGTVIDGKFKWWPGVFGLLFWLWVGHYAYSKLFPSKSL